MSKKKIPRFQFKAFVDANRELAEVQRLKTIKDVLERSGLDTEASKIEQRIREHNKRIMQLRSEALVQRKALVRAMLLCFAAGDIATTCADKVSETFDDLTYGQDNEGGNALAQLFREQATRWNECVQMIDGDSEHGDDRVSMYYADIAAEIVEAVIPQVLAIIDRHMASDKGKRLL